MHAPSKLAALAALALTLPQPCAAAPTQTAAEVRFDLARHAAPAAALPSMSLAASRRTAAETEERKERRGIGRTTLLVAGGLVLAVLVLAAVAAATPRPGPAEGVFN